MVSIPGIITSMTKADALGPIVALEATVTGGRTWQARKRGGKDEARERLIEESTGAVVWLGGVKFLNWIGDKILDKAFKVGFDVGTDNVLRTPFENFIKKYPHKSLSPKAISSIKAVKVLSSVLLADAFIGLVVPPLNQRLTRNLRAKKEAVAQDKLILENKSENNSANPAFKGGFINTFTNFIENTNTGKLLSTDAGLVSGRMYSARNKEERREIAIRDIGSIYFYMWAQSHVGSLMNFIETGKFHRLDPSTAVSLNELLTGVLERNGEMSPEEFRKVVLGDASKAKLPENITFETGKLSFFDKIFNRFRKVPKEPLQVVKVSELESIITDSNLLTRIKEMSKLQPLRQGEAVITKQQIFDAINECEINNPKFLDRIFSDFTGGKVNKKTGIYEPGASKNEFRFVSNKKLYDLKALMEDYVEDICQRAKNGKITKDILKKAKNRNLAFSALNFVAGFAVAATFLSTLIPKFQYWVTRKTTGKDLFPGVYEEDMQKHKV